MCERRRRLAWIFPAALALSAIVGCDEEPKQARKARIKPREVLGKTTQDVRPAAPELEKGGAQQAPMKITAKDPLTMSGNAYVVAVDKVGEGFKVVSSALTVKGRVAGLDQDGFRKAAEAAKDGCPISQALKGNVELRLIGTDDPIALAHLDARLDTIQQGIDAGAAPVTGGGIEVRWSDAGWGRGNERKLVDRFSTQALTVPRLSKVQDCYLRQYDNSVPPKYSRYSAALNLDYPL